MNRSRILAQSPDGRRLHVRYARDARGRLLPVDDQAKAEALAQAIAERWGIAANEHVLAGGRRLDACSLADLRRLRRFPTREAYADAVAQAAEREAARQDRERERQDLAEGLTSDQVAEAAGLHRAAVRSVLAGKRAPTLAVLRRLASWLDGEAGEGAATFDPAVLEAAPPASRARATRAAPRARRNPWRRSHPDGSLELILERGADGRLLPNPGWTLTDTAAGVLDGILARFRDPQGLPEALAQVFVRNATTHAAGYSRLNQLLIALAGEWEAMGFRDWLRHGRVVRQGEKAIHILAPLIARRSTAEEEEDTDDPAEPTPTTPTTTTPATRSGDRTRRRQEGRPYGFRAVPVFGLSQTEGDPYPLETDAAFLDDLPFLDVAKAWGLRVATYSGAHGKAQGYYTPGRGIALGVKNPATFCHELTHAADDRLGQLAVATYGADQVVRADAEVVAELGGAALLCAVGLAEAADLGGAYAYLKSWAPEGDPRMAALRLLDRTLKAVALVIDTAKGLGSVTAPALAPAPTPAPTATPEPVLANPVRRRRTASVPTALPTVVQVGRLVSLIVRTDSGRARTITLPPGRHLAWDATRRDLLVCEPCRARSARPAANGLPAAARRHRTFHGAEPTGLVVAEAPDPGGPGFRRVGLLESLVYDAAGIRSPLKGGARWLHHFGDDGRQGHGRSRAGERRPFPEAVMPDLWTDDAGSWFIVRRPGNRYAVRDWIWN